MSPGTEDSDGEVSEGVPDMSNMLLCSCWNTHFWKVQKWHGNIKKFQKNTRSDIKIQNIGSIESIESIKSVEGIENIENIESIERIGSITILQVWQF